MDRFSTRFRLLALLAALFLAQLGCALWPGPTPTPEVTPGPGQEIAKVVEVVDGDTIKVEMNGQIYTVRYIGIDTPELHHPSKPVEYFAKEAYEANKRLVEGKTVILEKDVSDTDRYGRLLRYVYVGDIFVNAYLVEQGYARAATFPPDVKYAELFRRLEREAREAGRGLWEVPEEHTIEVDPACSRFDAPGNDNQNKAEECVCLVNTGDKPVDMEGWSLKDERGRTYIFPAFRLKPGKRVRVHTGCGTNTETDLYWCAKGRAVWDNKGDTVYLYDDEGRLVVVYSY